MAWSYELDKTIPQGGSFDDPQTSDKTGLVRLQRSDARKYPRPIYARHNDRHLVAVNHIVTKDPDRQPEIVDVTMSPECRVSLQVACRQLEQRNSRPTKGMAFYAYQESALPFISYLDRNESSCDLILPPGKYKFQTYGRGFHSVYTEVEIAAGKRAMDLGVIDHEPTQLALLEGLPAPELPQGITWKNTSPLTLKELRGKVVLLEFWGWWCGACVYHNIPAMMKLQKEYAGKDLAIVTVHNDHAENEVDTVSKLDEKLKSVREKRWEGHDIPFPVAFVPAKPTPFGKNISGEALNDYAAKYGIDGYPTCVLIDKQGNVVGPFYEYLPEHREKLKQLVEGE